MQRDIARQQPERQIRTLLVEPDQGFREILELELSVRGQVVSACADATDARATLDGTAFRLVVVNQTLPDADGLNFCREIRSMPGGDRVTLLAITSGTPRDVPADDAIDDAIVWPVSVEGLRTKLDNAERLVRSRIAISTAAETSGQSCDPFLIIDPDGAIRHAEPVAEHLLGFPPSAIIAVNAFSFFHSDDAPQLLSILTEALTSPGPSRTITARIRRDGVTWRAVSICAVNQLDDPATRGIVIALPDSRTRLPATDRLTRASMLDLVTDLPNRALFIDRVDHAIARAARRNLPVVVMVVDFDGLAAGDNGTTPEARDALAVTVAERLQGCLRLSDTAARLDVDVFGLLLEDIEDPANTGIVANRVIEAMAIPFDHDGNRIELTMTIGVALSSTSGSRAVDLIRDAATACEWARVQGAGGYVMFDPGMRAPEHGPIPAEIDVRPPEPELSAPLAPSVQAQITVLYERLSAIEQRVGRLEPASTQDE